jgi:hypothetical protein
MAMTHSQCAKIQISTTTASLGKRSAYGKWQRSTLKVYGLSSKPLQLISSLKAALQLLQLKRSLSPSMLLKPLQLKTSLAHIKLLQPPQLLQLSSHRAASSKALQLPSQLKTGSKVLQPLHLVSNSTAANRKLR